ncbi:MAG: signal peptide peptidase SppA [Deltaproteobacteria bacterium]|nr:signal peptide peptidase SppA [Deltaproteobacteria bacterium]MCW8893998.1 signal peptide peptidase SppA [Deltaproteobacteria bacterium]MCW9050616.1 signal peptide peptidase SppA [Deltaproteobacteria bacterium]
MASLTVGGIFLFFLLVVLTAGLLRTGSVGVPVGDKIGILEVEGTIEDARRILMQIDDFRERKAVKAVVLRVNSPGGAVGPSQEIYAELLRLANEKPLIVSMGSVAASGGYYLAIAGERLFANPGTITGSIGVIMSFPNYQELMGKVGIQTEVVKSGRFKDIGSSTRSFSAADRELIQDMINDVHQQFVEAVSEQRDMPMERLQPFIDGRIFTGRQAKAAGLIDELGTFNDAVDYAAKVAGVGDDPDLIYPEVEKENLFERYLRSTISHYLGIELEAKPVIGPQYLWNNF